MRIVVLAILLASLAISACSDDGGSGSEPTAVATTTVFKELPTAWPADFPVFADATFDSATLEANGTLTATFRTAATTAQVNTFYDGALATGPWFGKSSSEGGLTLWPIVNRTVGRGGSITVSKNATTGGTDIVVYLLGFRTVAIE